VRKKGVGDWEKGGLGERGTGRKGDWEKELTSNQQQATSNKQPATSNQQ
jgi:hypothetical protein